jgi:hypothetical protein
MSQNPQSPPSSLSSTNTPLFHKILVAIDGSEHSFKAAESNISINTALKLLVFTIKCLIL